MVYIDEFTIRQRAAIQRYESVELLASHHGDYRIGAVQSFTDYIEAERIA